MKTRNGCAEDAAKKHPNAVKAKRRKMLKT
jgi:hypothetical protein